MGLFDAFTKGKKLSDLTKYVGDFEIVEETDERGRIRRRAVYRGVWTLPREQGAATKARLWTTLALCLLTVGLQVWMLVLNHGHDGEYWVMVPLLAGLFPALYLLMGATSLPFRCRPMRQDQYMHSFIRVSRSATAVGVFTLSGLLISLILRLIRGEWRMRTEDWLFVAACTLIPALCIVIIFLLRGIDLMERENGVFPQDGGR